LYHLLGEEKTQLRRQDNIKIEGVNAEFVHLVEHTVRRWPLVNGVM
jgi:hypothetical protein